MPRSPFQRRIRFVTFMSGVFIAMTAFRYLMERPDSDIHKRDAIGPFPVEVKADDLDFGAASAQESFPWDFTIRNRSDHFVVIREFRSSCACTAITPKTVTLKPNSNVQVRATLDLRQTTDKGPRTAFAAEVLPIILDGRTPDHAWELKGIVLNKLNISPDVILYPELLAYGAAVRGESLNVRAQQPLARLEARVEPTTCGTASVEKVEDGNRFYTIAVRPSGDLPIGPFRFDCIVTGETNTGERLPPIYVNVQGAISPTVVSFPPSLRIGHQFLKQGYVATISLESLVYEQFTVGNILRDTEAVSIDELGGDGYRYSVTIQPHTAGEYESVIEFDIETAEGRRQRLQLPVRCHVVDSSSARRIRLFSASQ